MDKTAIENMTLDELKGLETELKGQVPSDVVELKRVQDRIAQLEAQEEQAQAQKVVIQEATAKADTYLDNFEIEGLTLSQLTVSSDACDLLRGGIQIKLVELEGQAANNLKLQEMSHKEELRARDEREAQLKRQNDELQQKISTANDQAVKDSDELTRLGQLNSQLIDEKKDSDSKRDAAVKQLEEAQAEITRLNSHIDDLRNEIAVGAQQAYKVVDMEGQRTQMKELADKIKASRVHVYDVVPDAEFNPKNFTAKRADNGETIQYNWTQANNYIELKDAAEVERFRAEHAQQSPVPNPPLDHAVEVPTIPAVPEVTAPEVQFPVNTGAVQEKVQVADGNSAAPVAGETVTRAEFEALKAIVKECAHVCDVSMAEVA